MSLVNYPVIQNPENYNQYGWLRGNLKASTPASDVARLLSGRPWERFANIGGGTWNVPMDIVMASPDHNTSSRDNFIFLEEAGRSNSFKYSNTLFNRYPNNTSNPISHLLMQYYDSTNLPNTIFKSSLSELMLCNSSIGAFRKQITKMYPLSKKFVTPSSSSSPPYNSLICTEFPFDGQRSTFTNVVRYLETRSTPFLLFFRIPQIAGGWFNSLLQDVFERLQHRYPAEIQRELISVLQYKAYKNSSTTKPAIVIASPVVNSGLFPHRSNIISYQGRRTGDSIQILTLQWTVHLPWIRTTGVTFV